MKRIYIPSDFLRHSTDGVGKTTTVGLLARYCCIFLVDEIILYDVHEHWKQKQFDIDTIVDVMSYLAIPQYLRRKAIPKKRTLDFAGLLPPLNIPCHPVDKEPLDVQLQRDKIIYRTGIVESIIGNKMEVDVGLEKLLPVLGTKGLKVKDLISVRIQHIDDLLGASIVSKEEIPMYWGYEVMVDERPFEEMLSTANRRGITIATSKSGRDFRDFLSNEHDLPRAPEPDVSLFFGPRKTGLIDFFTSKHDFLSAFDAVINFFPSCPTKSIRLEESIPVCLALASLMDVKKRKINGKVPA